MTLTNLTTPAPTSGGVTLQEAIEHAKTQVSEGHLITYKIFDGELHGWNEGAWQQLWPLPCDELDQVSHLC
jgi:hypothetical protein